jgi:hypothetical protein
MLSKTAFLFLIFFSASLNILAQGKPVRKGVSPVNTTSSSNKELSLSIEQLQGKWQEVKRVLVNQTESLAFTDSLLIRFSQNKVEIKDVTSMRMTMKGLAEIAAPNILIAAGDEFTVKSVTKDHLIISDGEFVRTLEKRDQYAYESYGKNGISIDSMNTPISFDPKNITGKWYVYRRQANAGAVAGDAFVIKSLEIFNSDRQGSATGKVAFYQGGQTTAEDCKIVYNTTGILVITDTHTWDFNLYKADGKDLVIGEKDQLLYYAKHY